MTDISEPVAVIGVGTMGHGMAQSALRAGIRTIVWDRSPEPTGSLAEAGAKVAESAADAARRAAIVITMVPDTDAVVATALDEGMLAALAPGSIWAQMSTIGVAGIKRVAALVSRQRPDVTLVDAPVSGSKDPAERGELTIFASGPDAARARITPLFEALGHQTLWVGPVGAGTRVKIVNNTWLAFGAEAVNASVALAHGLGLGTQVIVEALEAGPLVSPWQSAKLERVVKGDFSPQFALRLALKDVRLAVDAASDRLSALNSLAEEWERAVAAGLGNQDLTVVTQMLTESLMG
jgi:3-hydroxyisobutyrate dehydrogenase